MSAPGLPSTPLPAARGDWPLAGRIAFRVALIYLVLFCLGIGVGDLVLWLLPGVSRPLRWLINLPHLAALWTGVHLFGLTGVAATEHPTGSGDTALAYVECFCLLVFSLAGGAFWTLLAEFRHGRRDYRVLYAWLRLVVRFALAAQLFAYGFDKVFDLQFRPPGLFYLTETYGDSSPMRLLWAFMGYSVPYTVFAGLAEAVPACLLLFRRTATAGALASAGVMLNVVLLNFCYDVPVKLFSTHLLLVSLFLVLPDAAALWSIFFLGRPAALTGLSLPPWERRPLRLAAHVLQVLIIGGLLYQTGVAAYQQWRQIPSGHAPLYGVWVPDKTDATPSKEAWAKVFFDRPSEVLIVYGDGVKGWYDTKFDETARRVIFPKTDKPSALSWTLGTDGTLVLTGSWLGQPATFNLHKISPDTFPLQTRGFHWVQEYPYNH